MTPEEVMDAAEIACRKTGLPSSNEPIRDSDEFAECLLWYYEQQDDTMSFKYVMVSMKNMLIDTYHKKVRLDEQTNQVDAIKSHSDKRGSDAPD